MTELQQKPYRVLTIDGGGMRGLYSATVLDTLSRRFACQTDSEFLDVGKGFDLIVGTSTGGILACALAAGVKTSEIINLYRKEGPNIFQDPITDKWKRWAWRNRKTPANSSNHLQTVLKEHFQDMTLQEVYQKRGVGLCIPAVNASTHKPWVFKTPHDPEKQRDNKFKLVDVCLATSAAPMVFPLAVIQDPYDKENHHVFVDGGLWANNPILVGITEALIMTRKTRQPIEIISLGNCSPPEGEALSKDDVNWGLSQWKVGIHSLSMALDSQAAGYHFIADMLVSSLSRKCSIYRLPMTPPPPKAGPLTLDCADQTAITALTNLGKHDGNLCYGHALRGGELGGLVGIFSSMPPHHETVSTRN